jgi:hypothetical protein
MQFVGRCRNRRKNIMAKKDYYKRKSETSPIKDAIDEMLKAFRIDRKFNETSLIESWEKVMGKAIASRTEKIFIKNKKLYVTLTSAPLKQELALSKTKLITLLNKDFQQEVVEDVVFL